MQQQIVVFKKKELKSFAHTSNIIIFFSLGMDQIIKKSKLIKCYTDFVS